VIVGDASLLRDPLSQLGIAPVEVISPQSLEVLPD
jgi:hypothetical protein